MNHNQKTISRRIRDNSERAKIIIGVFVSMIVLNILSGINSIMFHNKYDNASYADLIEVQNSAHLVFIMIFGGLTLIMFVVAAITFLNWFRRAYYNLILFSKTKPAYDDDMAVWSFVIPFINLVRPYQIATEIYDNTYDKAKELSADVPNKNSEIVSIWWIAYVFLGIVIFILSKAGGEDSLEEIVDSMFYLGIAEFLEIPRLIVAILMVKTVSAVEAIVYKNRRDLDETEEVIIANSEEE